MSWVSDAWDWGSSLFDAAAPAATTVATDAITAPNPAGGWITRNSDWLKPVIGAGIGAYQQSQSDDTQSQYLDYLRQREDANYQNMLAQMQAGQGGGGDGGAARAAAQRQTEANRMAASKKANKVSRKTYKKLLEMYQPFRDTATQLLPQMTKTYENSLGMQGDMMQYLQNPAQMAKLDAAGPAYNVNVPLPDSVRLKK